MTPLAVPKTLTTDTINQQSEANHEEQEDQMRIMTLANRVKLPQLDGVSC